MTESNKNKIGIILLALTVLSLIVYSAIVMAEFYVSQYGEIVDAKVTDVSRVCGYKHKRVTLLIGSKYERVELYGISCRRDEFPLGSTIQVRRSKRLNIVTVPDNLSTTRLIIFPLFTAVMFGFLISSIKKHKIA
jgi:hypothetical protein